MPVAKGHVFRPLKDRLMAKIAVQGNDCWLWTGSTDSNGYGRICCRPRGSKGSRMRPAHAVAYELFVGPIPAGMELDHTCRTRGCVNPAHLDPVTHRENVLRGVGPSAEQARRETCPQGHPYTSMNNRGERICRICIRQRARSKYRERLGLPGGMSLRVKTHCPNGHEYTPENTVYERRGERLAKRCKTCRKAQH